MSLIFKQKLMILIADSGSTKTDWRLIDGNEVRAMSTLGINPYHADEQEIDSELKKLDLGGNERRILEIYFYGSGVANDAMKQVIRTALQKRIGVHPFIQVKDDLLGVARALFQNGEGIACILGTGSNSGLFQEGKIMDKVPALGYSLGDEGSGTDIGKRLVNALHKRNLSDTLRDAIMTEEGMNMDQILENVYQKPYANRYLASLTKIAAKHIDNEEIRILITLAFEDFIQKNISKYDKFTDMKIGFAGSVAFHFQEILKEVISKHGLQCDSIIASPIEGLMKYHKTVNKEKITEPGSITESTSMYDNLEEMSVKNLLENINREDGTVHQAVQLIIPEIEKLVDGIIPRIKKGGRLFYVGAGTSGRLGVDAGYQSDGCRARLQDLRTAFGTTGRRSHRKHRLVRRYRTSSGHGQLQRGKNWCYWIVGNAARRTARQRCRCLGSLPLILPDESDGIIPIAGHAFVRFRQQAHDPSQRNG